MHAVLTLDDSVSPRFTSILLTDPAICSTVCNTANHHKACAHALDTHSGTAPLTFISHKARTVATNQDWLYPLPLGTSDNVYSWFLVVATKDE